MPFMSVHARLRPLALVAALSLGVAPIVATPAAATPPAAVASTATPVAAAPSMVTAPVAALRSAKPTIKGKARVGNRLTARPGRWAAGTTFSYTWKVGGAKVASGKTFTPKKKHLGKKVTVTVKGKKSGATVTRKSAAKKVVKGVFAAPKPKIVGTAKVGATLTARPGTWKPKPASLRYQWRADGKAIKGATSKKYKLKSAQQGKRITVKVKGTRSAYKNRSRTSAATRSVIVPAPIPGDGQYRIGAQVSSGTYVSRGGSSCYWERRTKAGSSFDGIITNGFYRGGQVIVTIPAGDRYFTTEGCGRWITLSASGSPRKTSVSDGIYAVGRHMAAGTYRTSGGSGCYFAVTTGFSGDFDEIIENDYTPSKASRYVEVANGHGFETSDCGTWTRVSG